MFHVSGKCVMECGMRHNLVILIAHLSMVLYVIRSFHILGCMNTCFKLSGCYLWSHHPRV